jgi:mycothiol synthase
MTDTLTVDLLVRAPTIDDLCAVNKLINMWEIAQYGIAEITQESIRTQWQEPGFDLGTDAWVVVTPDNQLVGYGALWHHNYVRMWTEVAVRPDYNGRGIGTRLLRLAEAWARQHITKAPPDARITLLGRASSVEQAAQQRLERAGYKLIRHSWRMEIEMNEVLSVPQWPEGIAVHPFVRGQDERAVFETDEEAFQDHWGHLPMEFNVWEHWTVKRENFDPSLWFLAYEGNELAGICLCKAEKNLGWVDTLAVRRPWRRRGLGMALLLHSFAEFYQRGIRKVGLGVDAQNLTGATRLYERAGMHVARQDSIYEKELRPGVELSTQFITA